MSEAEAPPPDGTGFSFRDSTLRWFETEAEALQIVFDAGVLRENFRIECGGAWLTGRAGAVRLLSSNAETIEFGGEGLAFADAPLSGRVRVQGEAAPQPGRIAFDAPLPPTIECSIRYFYGAADSLARFVYPALVASAETLVRVEVEPRRSVPPYASRWSVLAATGATSGLLTTEGLAVTLAPVPESAALVPQWDPVASASYLAPSGEWQANVPGATGPVRVACGLSSAEHIFTPASFPVWFSAGNPAYAGGFTGPGTPSATGPAGLTISAPGSPYPVTTAWAYLPVSADGPTGQPYGYYSQPQHAGWFAAAGDFLAPAPLLSATLPAGPPGPSGPLGFPIGLYGALAAPSAEDAVTLTRFESGVLAPARLAAIHALAWPEGPSGASGSGEPTGATATLFTPQGLQLGVAGQVWQQLVFATSMGRSLALADLDPRLASAFQGEQLFLVIDKPGFARLLADKLCKAAFDPLSIHDWTFFLDPAGWNADTLMIVKFAGASLPMLAADLSRWTLPTLVTGDPAKAQQTISDAIAAARAKGADPDYAYFVDTVLDEWNGILFLNVPVPAASFPEQLMALTAGMKGPPEAHHLGIDLSPVTVAEGVATTHDAKLFGLILHEDPSDLTYHGSAYDFKTQSLRVLFANSAIAGFSSQIELLLGQLFGERSVLVGSTTGDNVALTGTLQQQNGADVYSFAFQGANGFAIQSAVLQAVRITRAEMITVPGPSGPTGASGASGPSGASGATTYTAQFPLAGTIAFQAQPGFDLFSFGPTGITGPVGPAGASASVGATGLAFGNLLVSMDFVEGDTNLADRKFAFDATRAVLSLPTSDFRPGSLYDGFPLTATGFLQGGAGPTTQGYLPMGTPPLTTGPLGGTWFGLAMDLALGTRGGLAGMAPLTASVLAAWAPGSQANVATLAMLPGVKGIKSLSLMGPLKLSLGDSSISWTAASNGDPAYVMRFNDIALSVFGVRFPSGGRVNAALFSDPNPARESSSLGWYAAYQKNAGSRGSG